MILLEIGSKQDLRAKVGSMGVGIGVRVRLGKWGRGRGKGEGKDWGELGGVGVWRLRKGGYESRKKIS